MGGAQHPAYEALGDGQPSVLEPYAYYLRVPDLPAFLNLIRPALEKRLAASIAAGYNGILHIGFYRDGLKMTFERGRITGIESWKPRPDQEGEAAFPNRIFLQLLFG
jgi:hypothetical protein